MLETRSDVSAWFEEGRRVALATVIATWGSSPRRPGAKMAVNDQGAVSGSVSGGCVEGAVIEAAEEVLESGLPRRLHFGVADETAWEVGLACGGEIDIFVQPLDAGTFDEHIGLLDDGRALATLIRVGGQESKLGWTAIYLENNEVRSLRQDTISLPLLTQAANFLGAGKPGLYESASQVYFIDVQLPPPTLVIVGGVHITVALVTIANALGYRTVVVDPRRTFAGHGRFEHATEQIQKWPGKALSEIPLTPSTAVAVLTHDPKLDDPALQAALPSQAFYVGALGSRKTQKQRRARLAEAGVTEKQLDRLRGPIGIDIGSEKPAEIALAIMAEIVQARRQGAGIFPLII